MSPYITPHCRSQAAGCSELDLPPDLPTSANPLYRDHHHNQGGVGYRGGHNEVSRERSRGGSRGSIRGGFGRRYRSERRKIDDTDIFHERDIARYFWPQGNDENSPRLNSSAFNGSAARPDQLSYMLLFLDADPRWGSGGIVFAKSALGLLPGYTEQKAKNASWSLSERDVKVRGKEMIPQDTSQVEADRLNHDALKTVAHDLNLGDTDELAKVKAKSSTNALSIKYKAQTASEGKPTKISTTKISIEETAPSTALNPSVIKIIPASQIYTNAVNPTYPSIPPIDYKPSPHSPVAVFQEDKSISQNAFVFVGWYSVSRVNIIAPRSAEIIRMQQQKWERRDQFGNITTAIRPRDASTWQSSINHEWAVVKFEKLGNKAAPPRPEIAKTEESFTNLDDTNPGKDVADMLGDLGVNNGDVASV